MAEVKTELLWTTKVIPAPTTMAKYPVSQLNGCGRSAMAQDKGTGMDMSAGIGPELLPGAGERAMGWGSGYRAKLGAAGVCWAGWMDGWEEGCGHQEDVMGINRAGSG